MAVGAPLLSNLDHQCVAVARGRGRALEPSRRVPPEAKHGMLDDLGRRRAGHEEPQRRARLREGELQCEPSRHHEQPEAHPVTGQAQFLIERVEPASLTLGHLAQIRAPVPHHPEEGVQVARRSGRRLRRRPPTGAAPGPVSLRGAPREPRAGEELSEGAAQIVRLLGGESGDRVFFTRSPLGAVKARRGRMTSSRRRFRGRVRRRRPRSAASSAGLGAVGVLRSLPAPREHHADRVPSPRPFYEGRSGKGP